VALKSGRPGGVSCDRRDARGLAGGSRWRSTSTPRAAWCGRAIDSTIGHRQVERCAVSVAAQTQFPPARWRCADFTWLPSSTRPKACRSRPPGIRAGSPAWSAPRRAVLRRVWQWQRQHADPGHHASRARARDRGGAVAAASRWIDAPLTVAGAVRRWRTRSAGPRRSLSWPDRRTLGASPTLRLSLPPRCGVGVWRGASRRTVTCPRLNVSAGRAVRDADRALRDRAFPRGGGLARCTRRGTPCPTSWWR
jgi:hypothetical protein